MFLKPLVQAINRLTRALIHINRSQTTIETMIALRGNGKDMSDLNAEYKKEEMTLEKILKEIS